ncbi:MAG: YbaK/EbsC family protein [Oscillospiraceae bacterium]|nr:YbaK/EbsC family protein [Oscillospiraceae bacterium]
MSVESVREYLRSFGADSRVLEFTVSSATVPLAAAALGTEEARIAKTLSFRDGDGCMLIVCAGDARLDNRKYRERFGHKAKMLPVEEVEQMTGHGVGGVCPFAVKPDVTVYLDRSLQRFDIIYPAAGSSRSAVRLSPKECYRFSRAEAWVDVCRLPEENE